MVESETMNNQNRLRCDGSGGMGHWMEGDWPDDAEVERPEDAAIKRLLRIASHVASRLRANSDGPILGDLEQAIDDVESLYQSDDPRSNGWVSDSGLP